MRNPECHIEDCRSRSCPLSSPRVFGPHAARPLARCAESLSVSGARTEVVCLHARSRCSGGSRWLAAGECSSLVEPTFGQLLLRGRGGRSGHGRSVAAGTSRSAIGFDRPSLQAMARLLAAFVLALYVPSLLCSLTVLRQVSAWTACCSFFPQLPLQRLFDLYQEQRQLAEELVGANERLEHANLSFATALVATLDARDRYTAGHSAAVAIYSRDIAQRMGLERGRSAQVSPGRTSSRHRENRSSSGSPGKGRPADPRGASSDGGAQRDR